MSVLIRMKMPDNCGECPMICDDDLCRITEGGRTLTGRPPHCPLIEIHPHGRLIDAKAFDERIRIAGGIADEELSDDFKDGVQTTLLLLKTQRTIIPEEEAD